MKHTLVESLILEKTELEHRIQDLVQSIDQRPEFLYPLWLNQNPAEMFKESEFIVCGAGHRDELKFLARISTIVAIVDDVLVKSQATLFGIPIITTGAWIDMIKRKPQIISLLLVATRFATSHFLQQCLQHDLKYLTPLQFLHLLNEAGIKTAGKSGRFFTYGYRFFIQAKENINALLATTNLLTDDYSKSSFLNLLLYRLTLNPIYIESVAVGANDLYDYNGYLLNKNYLKLEDEEIVIDAGGFTGDSMESYLRSTGGRFKHLYIFEPSRPSCIEIRKRIERIQPEYLKELSPAITLIEKGVWDCNTELQFSLDYLYEGQTSQLPYGAHFIEGGMREDAEIPEVTSGVFETVPVTTIDEATRGDATYIKFEVEGSELKALHGARNTIKKNKPKMAIALYHKPEDFLTITNFVKDLDLGYKLGVRHHQRFMAESTYLYCY